MAEFKQLRRFSSNELLLSHGESRIVLKFIFKVTDHPLIDNLPRTDSIREFSQALLVEAIDASYSIGFVEALFVSSANPTKSTTQIIKAFTRKAAKHWFKHATGQDLMNTKVYQFVLDYLALHFRKELFRYLATKGSVTNSPFIACRRPAHSTLKAWSLS